MDLKGKCKLENRNSYLKRVCEIEGVPYTICWTSLPLDKNTIRYIAYTVKSYDNYDDYSDYCIGDTKFYQTCGEAQGEFEENLEFETFCNSYICYGKLVAYSVHGRLIWVIGTISGKLLENSQCQIYTSCWGNYNKIHCKAKKDDKCSFCTKKNCMSYVIFFPQNKLCDGVPDSICDADEIYCGHSFGLICRNKYNKIWLIPSKICDGFTDCVDGSDEDGCVNATSTCLHVESNTVRPLVDRQICSPQRLCLKGEDQANCTENVLTCSINGYSSNISSLNICPI